MKVLLLETGFIILSKYRDFVTTVNTGNWKPEYFFSHIITLLSLLLSGELGTLCPEEQYNFNTTTTKRNCIHLLRGLQLPKPILLEGAPGVGKTSLVVAVARMAGHSITRINLSEETVSNDKLIFFDPRICFAFYRANVKCCNNDFTFVDFC